MNYSHLADFRLSVPRHVDLNKLIPHLEAALSEFGAHVVTAALDPMDESNHADRFDADGDKWSWSDAEHAWVSPVAMLSEPSLEAVAAFGGGPLTFEPKAVAA